MIDMRKRFRGNKPVAVSTELEAGADEPRHMLYAGKPAVGMSGIVRDGKDEEGVERER